MKPFPRDIKVALVGAGNVATHLGRALKLRGFDILGVAARTAESAQRLAGELGCAAYGSLSEIPEDTDLVLIATTDTAVASVASSLPLVKGIVAHTSGSIPLEALSRRHSRAGVFYPLQTFSKDVAVDISRVPFFIEATDEATGNALEAIARMLSDTVSYADSSVRARLHVAGVLTSNFPIYLLQMVEKVLGEVGLPMSTVAPLLEATIAKAFEVGPEAAMTGPARRGDIAVVEKQSNSIKSPEDQAVYKALSHAILAKYHPELL